MSKSKWVNLSDEQEFIDLDTQIKTSNNVLEKLKTKFRKLFDKGYKFKLLTPKPSVGRVQIDWQTEAEALADKFMSVKEKGKWLRRINKENKPTPVATSFIVPKEK